MIRLIPLSEPDYINWITRAIDDYAADKVRAGNWTRDEAFRLAQEEFHRLLPNGRSTPDTYLFSMENSETRDKVGVIWLGVRDAAQRRAFIFDFQVFEPYRRRGYGLLALKALDQFAAGLGITEIGLHVFGHNLPARILYEKAGYEITNINMSRKIP